MKPKYTRSLKQKLIIAGVIFAVYAITMLMLAHYFLVKQENPMLGQSIIFNMALQEMMSFKIFQIFPLPQNFLVWMVIGTAMAAVIIWEEVSFNQMTRSDLAGRQKIVSEGRDMDYYNIKNTYPAGKKKIDKKMNLWFADGVALDLLRQGNLHTVIFGGPGTGKSASEAIPNLLNANMSYIVTDPSGELLRGYGKYLENKGYDIKVFNLIDTTKSSHYNPLMYLEKEEDVDILVNTLIENTTSPDQRSGEKFWQDCEILLISACIFYLWKYRPVKERNFSTLMTLVRAANVSEEDSSSKSPLDGLMDEIRKTNPNDITLKKYDNFRLAAGKTLKGILISVAARLQAFDLQNIQNLTNYDDIHLDRMTDHRTAMFILIPTADDTFNFIAAMMYSQLFQSLYYFHDNVQQQSYLVHNGTLVQEVFRPHDGVDNSKEADDYIASLKDTMIVEDKDRKLFNVVTKDGVSVAHRGTEAEAEIAQKELMHCKKSLGFDKIRTLPNPVLLILDEFANIGKIPHFDKRLNTSRKYGLNMFVILQSLPQLKYMYKDNWGAIVGNCDVIVFLGGQDLETNEYLSKIMGQGTIQQRSDSISVGGSGSGGGNVGISLKEDTLFKPADLAQMDNSYCIYHLIGENPIFRKKNFPFETAEFEEAKAAGFYNIPGGNDVEAEQAKETAKKKEMQQKIYEERQQRNAERVKQAHETRNNKMENGTEIIHENLTDKTETDALNNKLNNVLHKVSNDVPDESTIPETDESRFVDPFPKEFNTADFMNPFGED